jgi:hypothetical protein
MEAWEEELEEHLGSPTTQSEKCSWSALWEQIKSDLNKQYKSISLSQINQLMILHNFATLCIKGAMQMEASLAIVRQWHEGSGSSQHFACQIWALVYHYEVFEQLPQEWRGGAECVQSLFKEEAICHTAWSWLLSQTLGSVTLQKFHHTLCEELLPSLGILLTKPLCEQTVHHWMIKLGWRLSKIQKGVYMDGHEWADVVKYLQETFLPKMAELEHCVAKYVPNLSGNMEWIEPDPAPGEKELIPEFQDETCCQANEHASLAWWVQA